MQEVYIDSDRQRTVVELRERAERMPCEFKYRVLNARARVLIEGREYRPTGGLEWCNDDEYCSNGNRSGCEGKFLRPFVIRSILLDKSS